MTVYNGVPEDGQERSPSVPATVGSVGTVCRAKGTDVFLEAIPLVRKRFPELRFEHIGQRGLDEDAEFDGRISRLLAWEPLASAVTMLGRRPAAEGLARWETFVLPSRQDAFPLATLEAMAAGVPVVASAVGGVTEQIDNLETGILVAPEDPELLAKAIIHLHEDRSLRERLGRAAAASVRERFGIERQADGLHRAYLAALNLRHGPARVRRATLEAL
jgi:glycosyltransferase involved in cell wall biosynthesis